MLSTPLITTKFHIPPSRADFVPRPQLHAILEAGSRQPLTLVSAPPGFGKTMLAADWIDSQDKSRIAWLSLDESDDLPALFWKYFITALQQRRAGIGETARAMLSTPEPLALETVLATLIGEAASFLNAAMGLALTPEQIELLERRTEGWIVGLQMAALSIQGRDPQAFLDSFAGDDRYIADYLIEEVLNHQPEAVRDFLLRTSILEKLSAPLCAAVLGGRPKLMMG